MPSQAVRPSHDSIVHLVFSIIFSVYALRIGYMHSQAGNRSEDTAAYGISVLKYAITQS